MLQGRHPQPESAVSVKLTGEQALVRGRKIDRTGQLYLGDLLDIFAVIGVVHQNTVEILNGTNNVTLAVKGLYLLTQLVDNARQRRIIDGIGALFIGRRKPQGNSAPRDVGNDTQTQSGIAVAHPTLTDDKFRCFQETSASKLLLIRCIFPHPVGGCSAHCSRHHHQIKHRHHGRQGHRQAETQC